MGRKTSPPPPRTFDSKFAELAELVAKVPENVARLDQTNKYVPGYEPENASGVTMHLLGPIVEDLGDGAKGLRYFEDDKSGSKTRNGHSIVMRLDYGNARLLLTGDLNTDSQRLLLSYIQRDEFTADVAKGCHHGSDDIDLDFVRAMAARATVISSGDNETYAHPRPRVMGASARYGRESQNVRRGDRLLPPLLYSTELARSVKLEYAASVRKMGAGGSPLPADEAEILGTSHESKYRPLPWTPISTNLVYGLVNVRTDGKSILCATMEESGSEFDIQVFGAGVAP